ncbi:LysR family transcriptional regulator [Bordetella genomosp. 9]|uniref:LysR family transcriptional regulator n=1 Tax=Bordetella genomosp. 9 TaxID=1416803 RepID=A0A1W6Z2T8_9BORD|nr:LysR family transcriptional regulator [Bordetella genomosp. 9]ARP87692.1 LysR family transcriptional regulator [Bordetella genomosp. 9]ARP91662.1 LysR family transcriptional regulator [Bordetella genomosp. 9]
MDAATIQLNDIALFVEVARRKSFSLAARALNMPTSTLSRRISELERAIGMRLLNRNTRRLDLTEAGAQYFERCQGLVDEARFAHEQLFSLSSRPEGKLTVSLPNSLAILLLPETLQAFTDEYPEIELELDLSLRAADPHAAPFDVMLRMGEPAAAEGMEVRELIALTRHLYASRAYLEKHGWPQTPADLARHECLRSFSNEAGSTWLLCRDGQEERVTVHGRITANNMGLLSDFASMGLGIAPLPVYAATHGRIASEYALSRVLPEWTAAPLPVYAIFPSRILPAKTRAFMDFIVPKLAPANGEKAGPAAGDGHGRANDGNTTEPGSRA